jgi:hypothetical protein
MFKFKPHFVYSPDTGNATGAGGSQPAQETPPAQPTPPANSGEPKPTMPPADPPKGVTFESEEKLQEHINKVLADRLEREKRKAEKQANEAREKAEADAAAKNGEWQKLAETRETKITELTQKVTMLDEIQAKADRYEKALKAHLDTQIEGLPEHVVALLKKLDVAEQLEYITKNREALGQTQRAGGPPPSPKPGTAAQLTATEQEKARMQARAQAKNRF